MKNPIVEAYRTAANVAGKMGALEAYVQDEQTKREQLILAAYCKERKLDIEALTDEEKADIIDSEIASDNDFNYGGDMYETDLEEHGTW